MKRESLENKNYAQWKISHYTWDSVENFKSNWDGTAGIHTIYFIGNKKPIDIYVNEFVAQEKHSMQPIFFNGAISKRNRKKGPFFSGLGIAFSNSIPLIAIADPTLDDDLDIDLGWYVGGPDDDFERNLNSILTVIAGTLERELIFVGGSGGGFAALNFARNFAGTSTVFVWNPQTDIYEYFERFVKAFLKSRFNFAHSTLARSDWKEFCRTRTKGKISTDVLNSSTLTKPRRLIYLQNISDWHKESHLAPLWSLNSDSPLAEGMNEIDNNHVVIVDRFAEGHTPPSTNLIESILLQLLDPDNLAARIAIREKYRSFPARLANTKGD